MKILAIETSCDETAAAIIEKSESKIAILSNVVSSQIPIHKKYGGVYPEIASRAHTEKIIKVVEEAISKAEETSGDENSLRGLNMIDTLAATIGPGLIGSLLVGVNFAKTLSFSKKIPIIGINHLIGHIYSNFSSDKKPQFPAIILIVSGGHTGLYLMKSHKDICLLGETQDDAAGEAFDKVAKLLNLGYPGGPIISKIVKNYKKTTKNIIIKFPRPMLQSNDYNFSFSGLKTAVLNEVKNKNITNKYQSALASEFQQAVIDVLIGKTIKAAYELKPKSICLCGGVSANYELRQQMEQAVLKLPWKTAFHVPPLELSTDNAAMIGLAAAFQEEDKFTSYEAINANANLKITS